MTLGEFFRHWKTRLTATSPSAALDVRLLLGHGLGLGQEKLLLSDDRVLSMDEKFRLDALLEQRAQGRPIAKIIGFREFYGRRFSTGDDTLDPRPDSETLIDAVLSYYRNTVIPAQAGIPLEAIPGQAGNDKNGGRAINILDLGTGTGCLVLTLLAEISQARGIAVDQSSQALATAKKNAVALGIEDRVVFTTSDWLTDVIGTFDIIISNPPYIPSADIAALSPDVRLYDPLAALDGGDDGLDPYRIIIPQLPRFLNPHGAVFFEVGQGQAQDVAAMLVEAGFARTGIVRDLGGIGRIVSGIELQKTV